MPVASLTWRPWQTDPRLPRLTTRTTSSLVVKDLELFSEGERYWLDIVRLNSLHGLEDDA